jgi:hypothetical protein
MVGRKTVKIRTWRERQQRWLVNQRFATQILLMMSFNTSGGIICLVAWAMYFANHSRSSWKARVGKEVATWLSMPSIVLGLHYESEIGQYFEEVYAFHNRPGPLYTRPGFRIWSFMEFF